MIKDIKVVHLCSGISYCTAAYRINQALINAGINSKIVCVATDIEDPAIYALRTTRWWKIKKVIEKYGVLFIAKKIYNMSGNIPFSAGFVGNREVFKRVKKINADIIHLHWINDGMLSISDIKRLGKIGKPIIITTHDMWFVTGGCHISKGCERFQCGCGQCRVLQSKYEWDISHAIMAKKKRMWSKLQLYVTSPSHYMNCRVKNSYLFNNTPNFVIPNTLDTNKFHCYSEEKQNDEISILFGASHILLPHKGFDYLVDALKIFKEKYPCKKKLQLLILGKGQENLKIEGFNIKYLGYLNNEESMAHAYSQATVFVVPSLEDTFNQSVAESMACETPVVAFDGTGITEIIDHKINGYLAKYKNAEDLAYGIKWTLNQDIELLGKKARGKIVSKFDYNIVGEQFKKLYEGILNEI